MAMFRNIPWPRILAEGAVIVVSILLAFWIDEWADERQERDEERRLLRAIQAEIEGNIALIEPQLEYREHVQNTILRLFAASDGEIDLSPSEFDSLAQEIALWRRSFINTTAVDSLSQGDRLYLVSDDELRDQLAALPSWYEWMENFERREEEFSRNYINPFYTRKAFLPQIANAPIPEGLLLTQPTRDFARGDGVDHRYLLKDQEFLGLLVQERWDHQDTVWGLNLTRDQLEKTLEMVRPYTR